MSDRKAFEKQFTVPDDAVYNGKLNEYCWVSHPTRAHPHDGLWEVWQAAKADTPPAAVHQQLLEALQAFVDCWSDDSGFSNPYPEDVTKAKAAILAAQQEVGNESEAFDDWPEYHEQGMGCGLEDRCITDRYEAMRYGWDEAIERVAERLEGYARPPYPQVPEKLSVRPHKWDAGGERCVNCGDKDWMASPSCDGSQQKEDAPESTLPAAVPANQQITAFKNCPSVSDLTNLWESLSQEVGNE